MAPACFVEILCPVGSTRKKMVRQKSRSKIVFFKMLRIDNNQNYMHCTVCKLAKRAFRISRHQTWSSSGILFTNRSVWGTYLIKGSNCLNYFSGRKLQLLELFFWAKTLHVLLHQGSWLDKKLTAWDNAKSSNSHSTSFLILRVLKKKKGVVSRLTLDAHPWSTPAKLGPRRIICSGLPVNYIFKLPIMTMIDIQGVSGWKYM